MRLRAKFPGLVLSVLGWSLGSFGAENVPSPAEARLRSDVTYLADDAREGRAPGSKGIEAAAEYVAEGFKQAGLRPARGAEGFFQPFEVSGVPVVGTPLELAVRGPEGKTIAADGPKDFVPLLIGSSGTVAGAPVVFAGYGITAQDEAKKWDYDDYAGVDVRGKAVVLLRHEPRQDKDESPFGGKRPSDFATFRHKATNAFQHGAVAIVLVNDHFHAQDGNDPLGVPGAGAEVYTKLPFVMASRAYVDKVLAAAGQPALEALEQEIDSDFKPRSRALTGWTLDAKIAIERKSIATRNVVGVLEGAGPRADETVVVGAHYDHLGRGGLLSGSLAFFSKDIHNGADDNASGTAMVVELARRLAHRADPLPRRVMFIAFSGEERGLLGSQYYVEHPLYPLNQTVLMLNSDMVGRLNDKNELSMIGTGSTAGIDPLIEALGASSGLKIKKVAGLSDGFGGSDHQSFYKKDVPVLFAFTGVHRDYHRPTDDVERVNFSGMARIADYLEMILLDVVRRPVRPEFVKITTPARHPGGDPARTGFSVSIGIMPDYGDEGKNGLKLAGVREGGPAEQAGLKEGDVIIGFAGKPVATIYDYMETLNRQKPGQTVEVVVKRNGQEKQLQVTVGSRPKE